MLKKRRDMSGSRGESETPVIKTRRGYEGAGGIIYRRLLFESTSAKWREMMEKMLYAVVGGYQEHPERCCSLAMTGSCPYALASFPIDPLPQTGYCREVVDIERQGRRAQSRLPNSQQERS